MQLKIRAWDKVNNRMQSWEELLAGKEFKAKLQDPELMEKISRPSGNSKRLRNKNLIIK